MKEASADKQLLKCEIPFKHSFQATGIPFIFKMRLIFEIIFLIYLSYEQAPKSRQSILLNNDGPVMPAGTLAGLELRYFSSKLHWRRQ